MNEEVRSRVMRSIRAKNTGPEITVRKLLHSMGLRYRLHVKKIHGTPDIVFSKRKKIILVNGCFWHRHTCSAGKKFPRRNTEYWHKKFQRTVERDKENMSLFKKEGWSVLVIWECQLKNIKKVQNRIKVFFEL